MAAVAEVEAGPLGQGQRFGPVLVEIELEKQIEGVGSQFGRRQRVEDAARPGTVTLFGVSQGAEFGGEGFSPATPRPR